MDMKKINAGKLRAIGYDARERLLRGTPVLCAEDDVYTNHIHADDLARACVAALWRGKPQRIVHRTPADKMAALRQLVIDPSLVGSVAYSARRAVIAAQAVPVFALAPILTLWLGYGAPSKVVMVALVVYFPVASVLFDALMRPPAALDDLADHLEAHLDVDGLLAVAHA